MSEMSLPAAIFVWMKNLANAIQIVVQLSFDCSANMEMTSKLRWVSSNGHIKDLFQVRLEFIFHKKQQHLFRFDSR